MGLVDDIDQFNLNKFTNQTRVNSPWLSVCWSSRSVVGAKIYSNVLLQMMSASTSRTWIRKHGGVYWSHNDLIRAIHSLDSIGVLAVSTDGRVCTCVHNPTTSHIDEIHCWYYSLLHRLYNTRPGYELQSQNNDFYRYYYWYISLSSAGKTLEKTSKRRPVPIILMPTLETDNTSMCFRIIGNITL